VWNVGSCRFASDASREDSKRRKPRGAEYRCEAQGRTAPVVARKPGDAGGAKGAGHPGLAVRSTAISREEPVSKSKPNGKPFVISTRVVWEAWQKVKANHGAAGVDEESIQALRPTSWGTSTSSGNRLSSGSYMPPPVRAVEIPKRSGRGVRVLGVPTVADRVAQTVVASYLEPEVGADLPPGLLRVSAASLRP
jgi:hypothetical protein